MHAARSSQGPSAGIEAHLCVRCARLGLRGRVRARAGYRPLLRSISMLRSYTVRLDYGTVFTLYSCTSLWV